MSSEKLNWMEQTVGVCSELGYRTTPVFKDGKALPFADGQDYKDISSYKNAVHVAIVLDDCVLLDYDGNHEGDVISVDGLEDALDLFEMPEHAQVNDKGDSIHWLFKLPSDGLNLANSCDGWLENIDVKRGNQLMHLKQGKQLSLVSFDGWDKCPQVLIDALTRVDNVDIEGDLGDFEGLLPDAKPVDEVLLMLEKLDPDMGGVDWLNVGHALHDWNSGKEGLRLWEEWSQGSDKYKEGECRNRWNRMVKGKGATFGTLVHFEKVADYDEGRKELESMLVKVGMADERALKIDIIPKIRKLDLEVVEREQLVKALQDRFKALTGAKISVVDIRGMIHNVGVKAIEGELTDEIPRPDWCKHWLYVTSHAAYVDLNTLEVCKSEAFNLANGKHIPIGEGGTKQSATRFVADNGFVELASSMAYMPMVADKVVVSGGTRVLNTFDPRSLPATSTEYSDDGIAAIERVKMHIRFICGKDSDAEILTQWLAHQVQHMGKKILWAPVIQSIQGVGKSFFGELLNATIGHNNVGTVSPSQTTSDFNGWATGVTVNVLEELRVKGHNRHDAVNALKPLVTDEYIQINEKGVKQHKTLNTANYICFTNYRDAIPVDGDDRRWWVIYVDIDNLDQLESKVGENKETYFPALFDAVRSYKSEIRKWLLEYPITEEFMQTKQAPMTYHKQAMIATEMSSSDNLDEVKDAIEEGGELFNEDCIVVTALFEYLTFELGINLPQGRPQTNILKRLGYSKIPHQVKIDGKPRRVWTRREMTNDEIRAKLSNR